MLCPPVVAEAASPCAWWCSVARVWSGVGPNKGRNRLLCTVLFLELLFPTLCYTSEHPPFYGCRAPTPSFALCFCAGNSCLTARQRRCVGRFYPTAPLRCYPPAVADRPWSKTSSATMRSVFTPYCLNHKRGLAQVHRKCSNFNFSIWDKKS